MRFTPKRTPVRPCLITVLVSVALGGAASAQDVTSRLRKHAEVARDPEFLESRRTEHARAFMIAARPEDWPLAFETIREVAHHRDQVEVELSRIIRVREGGIDLPESDGPDPLRDRLSTHSERERRRSALRIALRADDAVLEVFRSKLTPLAARSEPASFADYVARLGRDRDPEDRANNLRALGFFPTPASLEIVLAHLKDSDDRVALAAVRALGDHASAVAGTPAADSPWPSAFERLRSGLTRAWRDRDRRYRRYRVLARKSAAILDKVRGVAVNEVDRLRKLLEDALSGMSPEELKKRLASWKKLTTGGPAAEKALMKHREAGRKLRAQEREVRAHLATAGRVFDRLTAEQRAPIEASLTERLTEATGRPSCLRLIELCGRLRSDAIGNALIVATSAPAAEARVAACLALGRHGRPEHALPLSARLGDPYWQVETAAIRALRAIGGRKSVNALVTAVTVTAGRVREHANEALRALTGEDFHGDAGKWTEWWEQHGEQYRGPPKLGKARTSSRRGDAAAGAECFECFGVRTGSRRIVFVLDTSEIMEFAMGRAKIAGGFGADGYDSESRRIDHAVSALKDAISILPENAVFNILIYGDQVTEWKQDPVPAHARNKEAAEKWLARAVPAGGAAVFDALIRALEPAGRETQARLSATSPDTVFLLAGAPPGGRELAVAIDVVDEVERINRLANVVIHTIAVGNGAPAEFLRDLAARCGGRFVDASGRLAED